ncbi:hypothetical protein [Actinomycetospora callitridis]|uniref:hypothetical protein n=1 Tax=Actinomycetospora callitridis TaxID=913944 RepID=UPI00236550E3|nr:hypothetical protein [Actinomycetospora callitridis]MDD7917261.1 hypothetical protein [Actinomycetospora callitridis]
MTTHLTPASPTHLAPSYATPAWLLRGLTNEPGVLSLYAGRLRLVTGEGVVFDAPLGAVERLAFPWYEGAAGLRVTVGGRRHRVSLHRPRGSALPPARLMGQDVEPVIGAGRADADRGITVHSVLQGRGAGRVWRTLLQG